MAPPPVTEDYYVVLEVDQTAAPELIKRSYKRLALKLHPDRNSKHDATEAFQQNESKRKAYDLIYPSITRSYPCSQTTQPSQPPRASPPQSKALSEAAQIAALGESKQKRFARWWTKKSGFDSSIFKIKRAIRRLEQEIENPGRIAATEATSEAKTNSWGTWLLSPIYKKVEDSEDEKACKDREKQVRRIEKAMKERRLQSKKDDLMTAENLSKKAKEEVDAADLIDDGKIRVLQDMMREGKRG